jgi:uncharacterized protein (DUF983 family)
MQINHALKRCNCMYGFFKNIKSTHLPRLNCVVNHIRNAKNRFHIKKMVVNLQPQCDFCKDTMHHHKKRGLPRRFTTYFYSFCSNPKSDTGLPLIYILMGVCTWLWWHKIPVLSPLKLIIFVNLMISFKSYFYKFQTATHSIQTAGLARNFNGKFGHHENQWFSCEMLL